MQPQLNEHNKEEYPPMHTTEHIVNQTMIRLFGCGRAVSAISKERKANSISSYRNLPPRPRFSKSKIVSTA